MKVHSLHLKNTAHFSNLNLQFSLSQPAITLIVGEQGTGKSTLLKHLYHGLSWFGARAKDLRTAGIVMPDHDISETQSQSSIEICVQFPPDIGQLSSSTSQHPNQFCYWTLHKILQQNSIGLSRVNTQQLEQLVVLYQTALQHDQLQGLPAIAYYPADRFVHDVHLLSKNNPLIFQTQHAYDLTPLPYTTFMRFFEWLREIHDLENAHTAQNLPHWLDTQSDSLSAEQFKANFTQFKQQHAPHLTTLKQTLSLIFSEISDLSLRYHPKLQLLLTVHGKTLLYQQLPNHLKTWIALVGDFVRRLCLLNPNQLYPCLEGEGILIIDAIDHQLEPIASADILRRLQLAFPQVQIIATTHQPELLEYASDYQCLRLRQQQLYPIELKKIQHKFDAIYENLNPNIIHHNQAVNELKQDHQSATLEHLFTQIQHLLNYEQQQELIRRLNDEANPSSLKF